MLALHGPTVRLRYCYGWIRYGLLARIRLSINRIRYGYVLQLKLKIIYCIKNKNLDFEENLFQVCVGIEFNLCRWFEYYIFIKKMIQHQLKWFPFIVEIFFLLNWLLNIKKCSSLFNLFSLAANSMVIKMFILNDSLWKAPSGHFHLDSR